MSTQSNGHSPPHSVEAEEHLLSCCLTDGVVARCNEAGIAPESFFVPAHQAIFRTLQELQKRLAPIDLAVLAEELRTAKRLDPAEVYSFLTRASGDSPTTKQAGYFIDQVRELSLRRQFLSLAKEANRACQAGGVSVASLMERFDALRESAAFAGETMTRRLDAARIRSDRAPPPLRVVFRLKGVPIATPGNLVCIYAKPKDGKTAFAGAMLSATMSGGADRRFSWYLFRQPGGPGGCAFRYRAGARRPLVWNQDGFEARRARGTAAMVTILQPRRLANCTPAHCAGARAQKSQEGFWRGAFAFSGWRR
jgi:hypothetical protein